MSSQTPQRRAKRVIGAVQVVYEDHTEVVVDLSLSGVAFKTPNDFKHLIGASLPLTLTVPKSKKYPKGIKFNLEGEVKYTRFDEIWDSYMAGLKFKTLSKEDKENLEWLVDFLDEMNLF